MRATRRPRLQASMELVSLVDVVLLLLLFLILTAGATATAGVRVQIPTAEHGDMSAAAGTVIEVHADDTLHLAGEQVTAEQLLAALRAGGAPEAGVIVLADRDASWGRLIQVWDLCIAAGVPRDRIVLPAERTRPGDEGGDGGS